VLVIRTDRMNPADMDKPTPAMLGHTDTDTDKSGGSEPVVEEVPIPNIAIVEDI